MSLLPPIDIVQVHLCHRWQNTNRQSFFIDLQPLHTTRTRTSQRNDAIFDKNNPIFQLFKTNFALCLRKRDYYECMAKHTENKQ